MTPATTGRPPYPPATRLKLYIYGYMNRMPEGDGIELISAVRRAHPGLPIVAIYGRVFLGSLDLLRLAGTLGADATLQKPLNAEQFLAKVAHLLAHGR